MMLRNLVVLALLVAVAPARAGGIVLESYTGERPADASRLLGPVLEELARRDYATGDTVARTYDNQVSQSAMRGGVPADFGPQVDKGFKAWVSGRFDEAIKVLVPLIDAAHANTGAIARDPALRDPLLKAQIALALAYQRIGDPAAMRATFGEIIRSFPDAQISRALYGPDANQAFEQVRRDVQAQGRGTLQLKLTDDTGVIFINETYRAVGSTTLQLSPGEYRVVVMMNKQPSRNHRATVRANAETAIDIDAKLDQAIRTAGYTGFEFATQAERETHEARFAQRFARALQASSVAVVGIDDVRGRSAVVGSLVSLQSGREIRRASIPIEPDPSRDKLRALARFLAGDDPAPGLDVQFSGSAQDHASRDAVAGAPPTGRDADKRGVTTGEGRWGGWRWITAGVGIAGIGTGVVLIALDGACLRKAPVGQQCADFYHTATGGYVALGGGVLVGVLSTYLFATHKSAPVVTAANGGATIGFATRF